MVFSVQDKFGELVSFVNTYENTCCVPVTFQSLFLMWFNVARSDIPANVDL